MKDIIEILERWTAEGAAVALGSVVERIGSAPRDPGAALAVPRAARSPAASPAAASSRR